MFQKILRYIIGAVLGITVCLLFFPSDNSSTLKNLENTNKKLILFADSLKKELTILKNNEAGVIAVTEKYKELDTKLLEQLNTLKQKNEKNSNSVHSINELRGELAKFLSDSSRTRK